MRSDDRFSFIRTDRAWRASVRDAAAQGAQDTPRLAALNCTAAIARMPRRNLIEDGLESQLGTNRFGHVALGACGASRSKNRAVGRVVAASLGDGTGLKTLNFDDMNRERGDGPSPACRQSKLAPRLRAPARKERLAAADKARVKVSACHPGSSAGTAPTCASGHTFAIGTGRTPGSNENHPSADQAWM